MTSNHQPLAPGKLPPSARDFLAYERVVIDLASTRQVAVELKISQTRVRQIVRRVADWLGDNLPHHDEARDAAQLRLAQYIATDRLQRYLGEVSRAWAQTHESKYMTAILRILTAQSKLPAHPGTLEALAADALLGPFDENESIATAITPEASNPSSCSPPPPLSPSPSNLQPFPNFQLPIPSPVSSSFSIHPSEFPPPPPPEDCSPPLTPTAPKAAKKPDIQKPTLSPTTTSAPSVNTNNSARRAFLTPAHPPELDDAPTITELKITPQKLALKTSQPSSRRDRRRLKRLLAK